MPDRLHPHLSPPPLRGRIEVRGNFEIPYNKLGNYSSAISSPLYERILLYP